ncbi:MAG: Type 1 glutamine amidotransferase-like domain-containing protein [Candidatus Binataceae bacterium]
MTERHERHIIAMGGGGFSMERETPLLDDFVLDLARRTRRIRNRKPRIAFVGTASGDSDSYARNFFESFPPSRAEAMLLRLFDRTITDLRGFVLAQDVIYVGGGSTANLIAIWRLHGLDRALRAAWHAGVVLAGISAGALCWFQDGITDSFGAGYRALGGGLGFLRGGFCPHYDGEAARRPALQRLARRGFLPTLALDDGAAAHFVGTQLKEIVSSRPRARAFRVTATGGKVIETPLPVRYLGRSKSAKKLD